MNILNAATVLLMPLVPRKVVRYFALRYIAGESLDDAVRTVGDLNRNSTMATMDVLGEDITEKHEAIAAREEAKRVLRAIAENRLDANLSLKLTQFGLKLDKSFCLGNVREVVSLARELGNFIRIDMEDHTCTDDTLGIFEALRKECPNVGVVVQAKLHRTENDLKRLLALSKTLGTINIRLCKGIYIEPEAISYRKHGEINASFKRLLRLFIDGGGYVGIATHDDDLINDAYGYVSEKKLSGEAYEFQMLLGVRPEVRERIVADGHRLRVYVPYGEQWYRYSVRRFQENPQIAGYVFKNLFSRNSRAGSISSLSSVRRKE